MCSFGNLRRMDTTPNTTPGAGLRTYTLSGRRGLRVSPLSLGAGTFGDGWDTAWRSPPEEIDRIISHYLDAGGNVIDTANAYQGGRSEEIVGDYLKRTGRRQQVILATKAGYGAEGDLLKGGNARLSLQREVEGSLQRLGTDVIDLYYVHLWDTLTPVDEVMSTLDALVRAGKVRYLGLSNVPGWYLGRAQTLAEWRGWEPIAALQVNYSLLARTIEYEFTDAAQELGIGLMPWSPLANGLLGGKYRYNAEGKLEGQGRVTDTWVTDSTVDIASPATRRVIDTLHAVSQEVGRTPAQVALNWVTNRPGVVSTVIGARTEAQMRDMLTALDFALPAAAAARLDEASKPPAQYPYSFFADAFQGARVRGGATIQSEPKGYRGRGWR
jgi:aryl-alcohol dehydrogenase-like predicted oxidoreductase